MQFLYPQYAKERVQCPFCQWKGEGEDLSYGEFHSMSNIADLHCPSCDKMIGFVRFPVDESKQENRE